MSDCSVEDRGSRGGGGSSARDSVQKSGRGGRRPGAGRKPGRYRKDSRHRTRPELLPNHPVHVVYRMKPYVAELRTRRIYHLIRKILALYLTWPGFRVIHLSIQNNHLHLIVEAANRDALRRGMQSFAIRTAKAINRARNVDGEVFEYRYHATQITSPRQARNTLAYVLNNWRRHNLDITRRGISDVPYDLYSSAFSFDGWSKRIRMELPVGYVPLPVAPPSTSLLRSAYKQFGRIDPFERPGPIW